MKASKKKRSADIAQQTTIAVAEQGQPLHPIFRAYTQGRLPFPDQIDFYAMRDADAWLYEREQELREELESNQMSLSEAIEELKLLRMPQDCHASEKAMALLLSIGKGRLVQDLYEGLQTCMFDMAQRMDAQTKRFDVDEKWSVSAKLTVTADKNDDNKAMVAAETKVGIPAVVTAGSLFRDGAGNMLTPAEAVQQLSFFKFGQGAAASAAA
jgi:hypothetical protein